MSGSNDVDELVKKLYDTIISTARYTHCVLDGGTSAEELADNDPSFATIAILCKSLIFDIEKHKAEHKDECEPQLGAGKELLEILNSIVDAISEKDNKTLDDCTIHLVEYLAINKTIN